MTLIVHLFSERQLLSGRREMRIARSYTGSFTDVSEQIDSELGDLPIMIVEAVVDSATLTLIQADSNFLVIGWREEDADGQIVAGNWANTLTQTQINAVKTWLQGKWLGVPQQILDNLDTLVGLTRREAARKVVQWIRRKLA